MTEEENRKMAEMVQKALARWRFDAYGYDLDSILNVYEKDRKGLGEELVQASDAGDIDKRDEIASCIEELVADIKKIRLGWIEYLKNISSHEAAIALAAIYERGYKFENIVINPNPEKANELRLKIKSAGQASLKKKIAFQEALKNSSLPGLAGAEAEYHLYQMYRKGEGCQKNTEKALTSLIDAAKAGLPEANFELAEKLEKGDEEMLISRNEEKAYEHYAKASMCFFEKTDLESEEGKMLALRGNPVAQYICARKMLAPQNIELSALIAEIAADGCGGENRRYYKAKREKYLYNFFQSFKKSVAETSEAAINMNSEEKMEMLQIFKEIHADFSQNIAPYKDSFTSQEKKVAAFLEKLARQVISEMQISQH